MKPQPTDSHPAGLRAGSFLRTATGLVPVLAMLLCPASVWAAARTASVSGNWSNTATWGGNPVPVAGDTVTINGNKIVTVDTAAYCASITCGQPTTASTITGITISGTNSLTVSGAITTTLPGGGVNSDRNRIAVGAGSLSAASILLAGGDSGSTRYAELTISTGSVTVSGNITMTGIVSLPTRVTFTGPGTVNLGGNFVTTGTAMTFTPSTGTVNYNKAGDQAVGGYPYYNLILSGSGVKSMVTGTSVAGNLSLWPAGSPTASIGAGLNLAVNSLTLGGTPRSAETWGGTGSAAANIDPAYFAATTGILTVAAAAPPVLLTRTAGASPSVYGDALTFHAVVNPDPGDGSTVSFYANGVALGTATTTGGVADLSPALNVPQASGASPATVVASCAVGTPGSGTLSGGQQVDQKALTVSSPTAQSKPYDGTTIATVGGTLVGVVSGDTVTLNGSFADPAIGTNKPVTFGITQSGNNYTFTQPEGITADIFNNLATWINPAGGGWDTATNWQDSAIATGAGITADFNTLNITEDTTVSLNSARTIGSLTFGDTDTAGSAASWTLDGGTGNYALTLAGITTPTITVNALGTGKSATISASVGGTAGLAKAGDGTLVLGAANNYTGGTVIGAGTLVLGVGTALPVTTSVTMGGTGTVGTLDLAGHSPTIAGLTVGTGATAASQIIGNSSTAANSTLTVSGTGTFGGTIQDVLGAGDKKVALAVTGGTVTLLGANAYSGGTTLAAGATLDIQNTTALGASDGTLTINGGTLNNGNAAAFVLANGMVWNAGFVSNPSHSLSFGPVTMNADITVEQKNTTGNLSVGAISGAFNLTKTGAGKLLLTGDSPSFTGGLTVSAGTLFIRNSIANAPSITVASGAGLDVAGLTTAMALGTGQTLKASATGANTTGTLTTALNKGLTLSAGGLAFTAYAGGATAPLTVAPNATPSAGTLDLNGAPVAITTTGTLAPGSYILIAKSTSGAATATVTGTPGTLTVNGGAAPAAWSVAVTAGELVLTIAPGTDHTITASAGAGGTITPSGSVTVADGGTQAFTITADSGYVLADVLVDGVSNPAAVLAGSHTFTGVTTDHSIEASFITTFANWAKSKGLDGTPGKEAGAADDPDKDGRTNLQEFAFNGDPLSAADNGKVYVFTADVIDDTAKELVLTVAVRDTATLFAGSPSPTLPVDGITYTIEGSNDLSTFATPVTVLATAYTPGGLPAAGTGYQYRSFSLQGNVGSPAKGFLRAKVTEP